jgi:hypothetical protein
LPDSFLALPQSSICAVALEGLTALSNSFGYGAGEVNIMKTRVIAAVALLIPAALLAQEFRGTITGSVTDPQEAMIPNVKIVATHTETGARSATVSDSSGTYTIPFLAPGIYQITADAPGFKRFVREKFALAVGERPVLDIRMQVGDSSQTVSVIAEAPLLEIGNGSVGQVITAQESELDPLRTGLCLPQRRLRPGLAGLPFLHRREFLLFGDPCDQLQRVHLSASEYQGHHRGQHSGRFLPVFWRCRETLEGPDPEIRRRPAGCRPASGASGKRGSLSCASFH